MKKLLLSLGAVAAVAAPVAAVVACGDKADGGVFNTTANSNKDEKALKAITQNDNFGRSGWATALGVDATKISGGSTGGVTTYNWDSSALTLTSVDTNGDVKITTVLTITPKAAPAALKAQDLSVASGKKPSQTVIPTTSWYSTVNWDRALFLFQDGSAELNGILSATGTKLAIDSQKMTDALTSIKTTLRSILTNSVAGSPVYSGITGMVKQTTAGGSATSATDKLSGTDIELMAHNGPFTSPADALAEQAKTSAGKTAAKNIIFEFLYIKPAQREKFLDNLDAAFKIENSAANIVGTTSTMSSAELLKVWTAIYTESKASLA